MFPLPLDPDWTVSKSPASARSFHPRECALAGDLRLLAPTPRYSQHKPLQPMTAVNALPHILHSQANKSTSRRQNHRNTTPLGPLEGVVKERTRIGPFIEPAGRENPARSTPSKIARRHRLSSSRPTQHLYSPPRPPKHPSIPLRSLSDVQPIGNMSNRYRVPLSHKAKLLSSHRHSTSRPAQGRGARSLSELAFCCVWIQPYTVGGF